MNSVTIENNFAGNWINNTMTCIGTIQKNCSYSTIVPVGNYSYRFIGNDSVGNINLTDYFNYSVILGAANFNLFLDSQDSDIWVNQGQNVEIATLFISPERGTIYLYENEIYMGSCSLAQGCYRYKVYDTAGNYNISAIFYSTYSYKNTIRNHVIHVNTANITFVSPTPNNHQVLYQNYVTINITTTNNLSTATLNWNGTNYSMNIIRNNAYKNLTGLTYTSYNYSISVRDINGNSQTSETRSVTFANQIPNITKVWNFPANPGQTSNIIIYVNISDADNLQTMNCSLSGDIIGSNLSATNAGNLTIPISIGNKSIGTYNYNVTCSDGYYNTTRLNNQLIVLEQQLSEKIGVTFITPMKIYPIGRPYSWESNDLSDCFHSAEYGATLWPGPNCYYNNNNIYGYYCNNNEW